MEDTDAVFTFADGKSVHSVMRVILPCIIEGVGTGIVTEVVDCDIPLLLSRASMKKAGLIVNFGTDQAKLRGKVVNLKVSSSGHYLLAVSPA